MFYAGLGVGRGHELAPGPSWATTAGGLDNGSFQLWKVTRRGLQGTEPPEATLGSHKCKERTAFPNQQGGATLGTESSCITSPAVGPTVSARRHLTLCGGSGGGGQKAVTGAAARRYLSYSLSQSGNRDQPNALPGGKRSSLHETLETPGGKVRHPGPHFLFGWGGGGVMAI